MRILSSEVENDGVPVKKFQFTPSGVIIAPIPLVVTQIIINGSKIMLNMTEVYRKYFIIFSFELGSSSLPLTKVGSSKIQDQHTKK